MCQSLLPLALLSCTYCGHVYLYFPAFLQYSSLTKFNILNIIFQITYIHSLSNNMKFFEKEINFTMKKIEQNFTNFSALHFRAKNLLRFYNSQPNVLEHSNIFMIPNEFILSELEMLHTGLYMQPDEQVFN